VTCFLPEINSDLRTPERLIHFSGRALEPR
jgi:hypothetical protein